MSHREVVTRPKSHSSHKAEPGLFGDFLICMRQLQSFNHSLSKQCLSIHSCWALFSATGNKTDRSPCPPGADSLADRPTHTSLMPHVFPGLSQAHLGMKAWVWDLVRARMEEELCSYPSPWFTGCDPHDEHLAVGALGT